MNHETLTLHWEQGSFTLNFEEKGILSGYESAVETKDGQLIKTSQANTHSLEEVSLEEGETLHCLAHHIMKDGLTLSQEFVCHTDGCFTLRLLAKAPEGESFTTNYMAPLYYEGTDAPVELSSPLRFLAAPFDNDKWARFVDYPAAYAAEGYEFTAVHGENREEGLVIGSIDHDTWKTGLHMGAQEFKVYCGAATEDTRDLNGIGHGYVSGECVASSRIFVGAFESWQKGFQVFGNYNAKVRPALPWDGPVLFGWNTWAALMGDLSLERYKEASDFIKTLKHTYCGVDGNQYINFDAFWNSFSNKMTEAVDYVESNGQAPGTYFCPFITGRDFHQEVSGTDGNYFYEDLLLRDHEGNILPPVDGLYSLDPTHPGTLLHMEYELGRIIKWGFKSVKTDFVGHGCREGAFYNKEITTGVQAYNFGMKHFTDCIEKAPYPLFISLSIAPIFPHGYGHARRISCDAFGSLDQSEYLNNCITYLWWMNDCLYRFNDPDHIVTYKTYDKHSTTLEEGRTRYHAGVICGSLMLASDDYRIPQARERARVVLGNEKVNAIARKGESFIPLALVKGGESSDIFARWDEDGVKLALFNYSLSEEKTMTISKERLGFSAEAELEAEDLWSGQKDSCHGESLEFTLIPAQSRMILIHEK